ncbi:hypothetical protein BHE74_00058178 [Ensete ventricosum]|nr:hypothetical protein BHE74_00058178 [Ensete ventricosum]
MQWRGCAGGWEIAVAACGGKGSDGAGGMIEAVEDSFWPSQGRVSGLEKAKRFVRWWHH